MLTNDELKIAKKRYRMQKNSCQFRVDRAGNPIEMRLTFDQWLDIWLLSGHYHEMGRRRGQYVMSRKNDIGHYENGNVEIKIAADNTHENLSSDHWRERQRLGLEKRENNIEYQFNRQAMHNSAKWQENVRLGAQKRADSTKWREKNKLANQTRLNKKISCDSVIYESLTAAAFILAPAHINSKRYWLSQQMKKYPERYFHI